MLERLKQILKTGNKARENSVCNDIDNLFCMLDEDILRIEIGEDLVSFGNIICKVANNLRREIKSELGFIMPQVHILDNSVLQENEYTIYIRGKKVCDGFVVPNEEGITEEIYESLKDIVINNFKNILTNELTEKYIESVRAKNGLLVWDITGAISTTEIRIILGDLLTKGKSIKNIASIFEKISEQIFVYNKYNYRNPHKISDEILKQI